MRVTRRNLIAGGALAGAVAAVGRAQASLAAPRVAAPRTQPPAASASAAVHAPVVTANGWTLPLRRNGGWKEFHLVAEPVAREIAPGLIAHLWGYNGQSPGPTIECVEGDRVRVFVTNALPEPTSLQWTGLALANGMAGLAGLHQPPIAPRETFAYAFEARSSGTHLYRPPSDLRRQAAMGLMGALVVHPRAPEQRRADRDFVLLLNAYDVAPAQETAKVPTPLWTVNSRAFPGIDALVARRGDHVRLRVGNLSPHPLSVELHGPSFVVTGTGGGWVPEGAQWPDTVAALPAGALRVIEFAAEAEGDWALHCPPPEPGRAADAGLGMIDTSGAAACEAAALGLGPFGTIGMGPMFTTLKVRVGLAPGDYRDPGWYAHPPGTRAIAASGPLPGAPTRRRAPARGRQVEVKATRRGAA